MSFSSEVKRELLSAESRAAHCRLAELAGMLCGAGSMQKEGGCLYVVSVTEQEQAALRYQGLLRAAGLAAEVTQVHHLQQKNKLSHVVKLTAQQDVRRLLLSLQIMEQDGRIHEGLRVCDALLKRSCCRRAFLRGVFLTSGSISNPKKSYHFEIVCNARDKAQQVREQLRAFELDAKIVSRKNHEIVYLKEGSQIVDALNVMGAHAALMNLENVRIIKEMRNDINRRVNCETANINKTVSAACRQKEAIRFLQKQGKLKELSRQLQEMARLRMEYPEAAIKELGTLCSPPVGKSGVNHRLRKLEEAAEQTGYEKRNDQA